MLINGYNDLTIKTPDCHPGLAVWVARFNLPVDISDLFPYINAVAEDAKYFENPHYIQFTLDGIGCSIYPENVAVAPLEGREQALVFIKRLIDFLNDVDSRKSSIEPDNTKCRHISVLEIYRSLPQTNCSECGFPTCMAFAAAVSSGGAVLSDCPEVEAGKSEEAL